VKVRAHVGKIVNANAESARHLSKRLADRPTVLEERPGADGPATYEHDVHRSSRAHRSLQLAKPAPHLAAVDSSRKLSPNVATE
jgi:hypothetical protein